MGDNSQTPGDDDRTTRPCAGESEEDLEEEVEKTPRLVAVGAAVVAFVVSVANFALGQVSLGVAAASIGLLVIGAGLSWLAMERRRVRQAERDWLSNGPARK
jgi:hypothetical protein